MSLSLNDAAPRAVPADEAPGRVCPLRYRYAPGAIARADTRQARALYVVGGLYGNVPALDAIERMARLESLSGARLARAAVLTPSRGDGPPGFASCGERSAGPVLSDRAGRDASPASGPPTGRRARAP